jgi:hypothetical protein
MSEYKPVVCELNYLNHRILWWFRKPNPSKIMGIVFAFVVSLTMRFCLSDIEYWCVLFLLFVVVFLCARLWCTKVEHNG